MGSASILTTTRRKHSDTFSQFLLPFSRPPFLALLSVSGQSVRWKKMEKRLLVLLRTQDKTCQHDRVWMGGSDNRCAHTHHTQTSGALTVAKDESVRSHTSAISTNRSSEFGKAHVGQPFHHTYLTLLPGHVQVGLWKRERTRFFRTVRIRLLLRRT